MASTADGTWPPRLSVHVHGHPHGHDNGIEAESLISGYGGPGGEWVQLDAVRSTGYRVRAGFSGAGVVDAETGRVVGLLVAGAADTAAKVSWMLPLVGLATRWPDLALALEPPPPHTSESGVNSLLPILRDFTNRERERELLRMSARSASGVTVYGIWGMAGVGKTALALQTAHEITPLYPDAQLYIDLQAHGVEPPVAPGTALTRMLRLIGVVLNPPITDVPELAELWRAEVARRKAVVVLDNAKSAAQVRPLLPGVSRSLFLITSRNRMAELPHVEEVALDVFPPDDAHTLFARIVGEQRAQDEPRAIARLVNLCGQLPLALRVLADHLKMRPGASAAEILGDAVDEHDRLGRIDRGRRASVRATFDLSYRQLEPDERDAFRRLGLLPSVEFGLDVFAAVADLMPRRARALLEKFVDISLVQELRGGRFRMHDLMREYIRGRAVEEVAGDDRRKYAARALDYYLHCALTVHATLAPFRRIADRARHRPVAPPTLNTVETARAWFEVERVNLVESLSLAQEYGLDSHRWRIPRATSYAFDLFGGEGDPTGLLDSGLTAARAAGDLRGAADMYAARGDLRHSRSQIAEAHTEYEAARDHYAALGDVVAAADMANRVGRSLRLHGRLTEAREVHLDALAVFMRENDPYGQAETHHYLGILDRNGGAYDDAVARQRMAVELYRRAHCELGEARAVEAIGIIHRLRGDYGAAVESFSSSLRKYERNGDRRGLAHNLNNTASSMLLSGDPDSASGHVDQALELFRTSGNRSGESDALVVRARVSRALGKYDTSREDLLESLRRAKETGTPGGQANAQLELSKTLRLQGMLAEALERGTASLAIYRAMSSGRGIAITLLEVARCLAALHDQTAANRCREAIDACARHNLPELAEARALLAEIENSPSSSSEARGIGAAP